MTTKVVYVGNLPGDVNEKASARPALLLLCEGTKRPARLGRAWGKVLRMGKGPSSLNHKAVCCCCCCSLEHTPAPSTSCRSVCAYTSTPTHWLP